MKNTRSEVDDMRTSVDASRDLRTIEGHNAASNKYLQDLRTIEEQNTTSNKVIQDLGKDDEDEYGDFPLSPEDLASVVEVAERASVAAGKSPETPKKGTTASIFATPAPKRKWGEAELPTPSTGGTKGKSIFGTPAVRLNGGMWDGNEPFGSKYTTPSPYRFRDAADPEALDQARYDLTDEVMDILKEQSLDDATTNELRQLLSRHALKIAGIVRGRDISRVALKTKDMKIAELQQRITALETEREMDKTVIKHFKSDMSQSFADRRGRGRGKT
jgi:hypothetical protein